MRLEELPNPLPKSWEVELFLTLTHPDEYISSHRIAFYETDMSKISDKYQVISKAKVTFEIGDIDIPGIQIESLKKQKQKIIADAHVAAERIDKQIQSLLAIEYQPDADGAA